MRLLAHDLARLALGADEEDRAPCWRRAVRTNLSASWYIGKRLLEVDDVDLVAVRRR